MDDDALEALRREAEMEMRRKAPRELDGTDLSAKRRKTFDAQDGGGDDGDGGREEDGGEEGEGDGGEGRDDVASRGETHQIVQVGRAETARGLRLRN